MVINIMAKKFLTNIIVSVLLIYSVNIFINNLGIIVPINYFSVVFCGLLGVPGLITYITISIIYM